MSKDTVVLFDLDGTLIDSETIAMNVTKKYFASLGFSVTASHLQGLVGRPWKPAMEDILRLYPLKQSLEHTLKEVLVEYRKSLSKKVPTVPWCTSLICSLTKDCRLGIVSGSHREDIETVLESLKLATYFEMVVGFEDTSEFKPSPAPYLEMIRRLKITGEKILVFEDSNAGIRSAQAAGLVVIAVQSGGSEDVLGVETIRDFSQIDFQWIKSRARALR